MSPLAQQRYCATILSVIRRIDGVSGTLTILAIWPHSRRFRHRLFRGRFRIARRPDVRFIRFVELAQAISLRTDRAKFTVIDIRLAAILLLWRYKLDSAEGLRSSKKRNLRLATDDLRKNHATDYPHYKMLLELPDSPTDQSK